MSLSKRNNAKKIVLLTLILSSLNNSSDVHSNNNFSNSEKARLSKFTDKMFEKDLDETIKHYIGKDEEVSRAEFVAMVNEAFCFETKGEDSFIDVDEKSPYYEDILIGKKQGYINGYEDGTFRPDESISREEMSKILGFILETEYDNKFEENGFTFNDDEDIADWSRKYVYGLQQEGIISPRDNGFKPKEDVNIEEAIESLYNASKDIECKEDTTQLKINYEITLNQNNRDLKNSNQTISKENKLLNRSELEFLITGNKKNKIALA